MIRNTTTTSSALACLAGVMIVLMLINTPAQAAVILPGGAAVISGTFGFSPGTVIADPIRSMTLSDGTVIGIQDRVILQSGGNLAFGRVIRNISDVPIVIKDISVVDFTGYVTDADFDSSSPGLAAPNYVERDATGSQVLFTRFDPNSIVSGDLSRYMYIVTDATQYALVGITVVDAFVGGNPVTGTIDTYAPVPEPATLSLLALGGLAMLRRRRA
jgi:hypothetical protein